MPFEKDEIKAALTPCACGEGSNWEQSRLNEGLVGAELWGTSAELNCALGTEGGGSRGGVGADSGVLPVLEAADTACLSAAGHRSLMWGEHPDLLWFMAAPGCSSFLQDCSRTEFELLNFCSPPPPRERRVDGAAFPPLFRALLSSFVFCGSACTSACLIWS